MLPGGGGAAEAALASSEVRRGGCRGAKAANNPATHLERTNRTLLFVGGLLMLLFQAALRSRRGRRVAANAAGAIHHCWQERAAAVLPIEVASGQLPSHQHFPGSRSPIPGAERACGRTRRRGQRCGPCSCCSCGYSHRRHKSVKRRGVLEAVLEGLHGAVAIVSTAFHPFCQSC